MLTPDEFSRAYEQSFSRTVKFLLSRGIDADVAEEVAQSAWTRGWERQSQLQSDSALLPWVNSIALNKLRGFLRKKSRAPQLPEERQETLPADERMSLGDRFDLKRILDHCTATEQKLLWAYWGEGFTSKEIAGQLGIKPVSVRVRIGRLAKGLEETFHHPRRTAAQQGQAH